FPLMCRACKAVPGSQFSVVGRPPSAARCMFVTILSAETRSFSYQGSASAMPPSSKTNAPLGAANGCAKHFHIFLRQHAGSHSRIGDDVRGLAFGQQLTSLRAAQLISKSDHLLPHMFQICAHNNLVIIVHGSLVAALGIDYGDEAVFFPLHIFIAEAKLAEEFDTSHFKPDEMIGVIDDAHLVGFGISDADAGFIDCRRIFFTDRHRSVMPAHRPVHFGLRFSRNASIPSRKSALSRMPAFS